MGRQTLISVSTRKIKTSHILVKYKMASTKSVNVVRQVKPLLSVSKNEARLRVLALYKAWHRQIPFIVEEYSMPVNHKMCQDKVKERFLANAHVKDTRVIDILPEGGIQLISDEIKKHLD